VRIGLTYDLRDDYQALGFAAEELAEFDFVGTIDAIDAALRSLGHETERVGNVRALARRLSEGAGWDLVFNTAEGVRGFGREAQVPALLEAFEIAYTFSDPLASALTLHKGMAKRVLRDAGVPTAAFCVVADEADLAQLELPFPLFVKPVAEARRRASTPARASATATRSPRAAACSGRSTRSRRWSSPSCPGASSPWAFWVRARARALSARSS